MAGPVLSGLTKFVGRSIDELGVAIGLRQGTRYGIGIERLFLEPQFVRHIFFLDSNFIAHYAFWLGISGSGSAQQQDRPPLTTTTHTTSITKGLSDKEIRNMHLQIGKINADAAMDHAKEKAVLYSSPRSSRAHQVTSISIPNTTSAIIEIVFPV